MTREEQDAIVGRMVRELSGARIAAASLKCMLARYGEGLQVLGASLLEAISSSAAEINVKHLEYLIAQIPPLSEIREGAVQFHIASVHLRDLQGRIAPFGIQMK